MSNDLVIHDNNHVDSIKDTIYEVRGQKVMLDSDLAELYEVEIS